jgi:hypothetical protein
MVGVRVKVIALVLLLTQTIQVLEVRLLYLQVECTAVMPFQADTYKIGEQLAESPDLVEKCTVVVVHPVQTPLIP